MIQPTPTYVGEKGIQSNTHFPLTLYIRLYYYIYFFYSQFYLSKQVSSICPDSFLDGIDESILSAANGNEDLGSEWNWTSSTDTRLNSLFNNTTSSDSPPNHFNKLQGGNGGGPFTPL